MGPITQAISKKSNVIKPGAELSGASLDGNVFNNTTMPDGSIKNPAR